jgi:hypothetical protein
MRKLNASPTTPTAAAQRRVLLARTAGKFLRETRETSALSNFCYCNIAILQYCCGNSATIDE